MDVLLLGGTGTLSTAVRNLSLEKGYQVSVFNRGNSNGNLPDDVNIILGDFKSNTSLVNNFSYSKYDVVVDFLSREPHDIERVYPIFKNRCKQYIFISSACVYRRAKEDFPIVESCPKPNKDWSYNVEKYKCEETLTLLSKDATSYFTIVRPYITYDYKRIPLGIAPEYKYHRTIIERIKAGKPMFVWDGGETLTTLTSVEEFSIGLVGLFLNEKSINQDFHITTDKVVSHKEVLMTLYKVLDKKPFIVDIPLSRVTKVLRNYRWMLKGDRALPAIFDNSKIKNAVPELDFNISLEEGLRGVVNYYNETSTKDYDYMFDGQTDRLLSFSGVNTTYIPYGKDSFINRATYYMFRYLSFRIAVRFFKTLIKINL